MDNCTIDCIQKFGGYDYAQTCSFVQAQCHQDFIQFIQGYFCGLHSSFLLFILLGTVSFAFLYLALNSLTQHCLAPAVQNFIQRFHISHTLAGVTFLAFANGAPDVLTAIIAGGSSSDSTVLIPFGSIFGALLFACAFIFSAVIFASPGESLKVKKNQILVPLGFYVFGIVYLIIISISYKKMNVYLSFVLIVLYVLYISFVLKTQKKRRIQHEQLLRSDTSSQLPDSQQKNKLNASQIQELQKKDLQIQDEVQVKPNKFQAMLQKAQRVFQVTFDWVIPPRSNTILQPVRNITSLIVSPIVMGLSQDLKATFTDTLFGIPIFVFLCVPALILILYIVLVTKDDSQKQISNPLFSIYSFFITVCWVTIVCSALINLMELLQLLTNINSVYLGLTFLAWANSIGDYLSITMFAKRGKAATAISGIFSGQLFNFLIGFGFSLVIQSLDGEYQFDMFNLTGSPFQIMSDLIVVLVICSGLIYFVVMAYLVVKSNGLFQRRQAKWFRLYYVAFIVVGTIIAISTDFLRQFNCTI